MGTYLGEAKSKYRREGLRPTFLSMLGLLRNVLAGLSFGIIDQYYAADRTKICLTVRNDTPESDAFALLNQIENMKRITHLCIAYTDEPNTSHIEKITDDTDDLNVVFVKMHTPEFVRHMLESCIIIQKNQNFRWYRVLESGKRKFIRLYHGPITKAYGQTSTGSKEADNTVSFDLDLYDDSMDRSVGSDVELHFRAISEGRHPREFKKYGYPRFERITDFKNSTSEPVLPEETERVLESTEESTRILYATTHKDGVYETTFFPFESFDLGELREHLREQNLRIFIRPHPAYDAQHEELVDGEVIFSAGQSFSNSATEIMPFFDAVVTDYSSIYMESLPFDYPIIFVKDNHERFCKIRGFAFDYETYFPGPKVDEFDEFLQRLTDVAEANTDGFGAQRTFVKNTFLPSKETTFIQRVVEDSV